VGSSAEGARLVVFWGEQRNWGGGAAALRAERAGGRGMNHTHACRRIHTIKPTVRTVTVERGRVACLRLRAKVTRPCEVAAQGGSPTACLSCRGNKPGASSRSKPRAHGGDRTASCCAATRSPSRARGASPFHKVHAGGGGAGVGLLACLHGLRRVPSLPPVGVDRRICRFPRARGSSCALSASSAGPTNAF
jgi:hypothetical protein